METVQTFETLRALQDILAEKFELESRIIEAPKIQNDQKELLARMKEKLIETNNAYDQAKATAVEYRELLNQAEADREAAESKIDAVKTQREFEALERESRDAASREQKNLRSLQKAENVIAELDEDIKAKIAGIKDLEDDLAARGKEIAEEVEAKSARVRELEEQEKGLIAGIDQEVYFKFERIMRNKAGKGMVALKGGVCSGCHMILPIQFANDVRAGEQIVFCPYCSRILFYEESDQDEENLFDNEDAGSLADLEDEDEDEDNDEDDEDEAVDDEEPDPAVDFDE
ncbi:MAG: C4-type zinc ribbon domain-containing protein [Treponema sp.]|jgi:predicted  nucleic acid-binding Zn-ribbon protein|nr:C4-type zinc ribbon domain-containing protein [Treponema sp.]